MFCPQCRYEYKAGITICPDCNASLVETLPKAEDKELPKEYKDWIQLARINSQYYAEMLLEALRSKEIPAVIESGTGHFGQTGQMGVSFRPVGGGYSLYVPREFVKDADNEGFVILGVEWEKAKLVDIE